MRVVERTRRMVHFKFLIEGGLLPAITDKGKEVFIRTAAFLAGCCRSVEERLWLMAGVV